MNQQNDNLSQISVASQETSMRITSLRFLLAIFVVFIHNNLTADIAINYYHLDFVEPVIITWIKILVCNVLGGAAVPLFFMFAGYLQFKKKDIYPVLLKKKAKSLFVPYVIWTLLGVAIFFIGQSVPQLSSFFQNEVNNVSKWKVINWLNIFWVHIDGTPLIIQFWFVRDLMVIILISPLLKFLASKFPSLIITALILCYVNGLPLGFGTALFFYMCGLFFAEYDVDFFNFSDKISWIELICLLSLKMVFTIGFNEKVNLFGLGTIISCIFFLKLSSFIISKSKLYSFSKYLSDFSFFLYAIHMPFLVTVFEKISFRIIPLHGIGCLIQFILTAVITIILGTAIGIGLKKICSPLFALLNGGRR